MTSDGDGLPLDELVATGGTWDGLLFENPRTGSPLSLAWAFTFDFAEIERDFGSVEPSLCVDWVPLAARNWSAMAGQRATASLFGEPIESSIYFHDHHRFDSVDLQVRAQDGSRILVSVEISGDVDSLGPNSIIVEAWLDFGGIQVQPEVKPRSVDAARELLCGFIDPDGLVGVDRSHGYLFTV